MGDLVVGKRMGKLMSVLGGRLGALRDALPQGKAAVAEVITRNVTLVEGTDPTPVAAAAIALAQHLDTLSGEQVLAGAITP